jgi:hypothetical protein
MAYTVPASFQSFFDNINLNGDHHEIASARRDRIVSLLGREFEILDAFATGSISNYTAVKGHADLDVMVVLHWGKHVKDKRPSEVLAVVQEHLSEFRTGRRNGQAVTLYYDTWPNVDIVPVSRSVNGDGSVNYYSVPDMNDETWLVSRPGKHAKALQDRNAAFGPEFKKIIKIIKWWNHYHSSLLRSYHIEVLALTIFENSVFDEFSWQILRFFEQACSLTEYPLWNDDGNAVDEYLLHSDKRQEILKRLRTARDKSRDAWACTYGGSTQTEKAIGIWRQIFGEQFPAYGR